MEVQHIVLLQELQSLNKICLPASILGIKIEISDPEAITEHGFFMQYDADKKLLIIRYMTYDDNLFDFWEYRDVGHLIGGRKTDLEDEVASLIEDKQLFFLIATYEHGGVKHYPISSSQDISTCRWDTGVRSLFIPSESLIEECQNDNNLLFEYLKGIFDEYSDWCNGEVYALHEDVYKTDSEENILFIDNHDSVYGYIGYQNASECLKDSF